MSKRKPEEPLRGRRKRQSESLIDRDIEIYRRHMRGESLRAIGEIFNLRSTSSVHKAIERGKEHALARGIDVESHRLEINELFQTTIAVVAAQVQHQALNGLTTTIVDPEGGVLTKTVAGIDPRLAAELGRSLHRWSEFLGLMDRSPDAGATQQTTLIQLSAPTAGTDFDSRYGGHALPPAANQQTVDAAAVPVKETVINEGGPGWAAA